MAIVNEWMICTSPFANQSGQILPWDHFNFHLRIISAILLSFLVRVLISTTPNCWDFGQQHMFELRSMHFARCCWNYLLKWYWMPHVAGLLPLALVRLWSFPKFDGKALGPVSLQKLLNSSPALLLSKPIIVGLMFSQILILYKKLTWFLSNGPLHTALLLLSLLIVSQSWHDCYICWAPPASRKYLSALSAIWWALAFTILQEAHFAFCLWSWCVSNPFWLSTFGIGRCPSQIPLLL